jgi:hypothetical protein
MRTSSPATSPARNGRGRRSGTCCGWAEADLQGSRATPCGGGLEAAAADPRSAAVDRSRRQTQDQQLSTGVGGCLTQTGSSGPGPDSGGTGPSNEFGQSHLSMSAVRSVASRSARRWTDIKATDRTRRSGSSKGPNETPTRTPSSAEPPPSRPTGPPLPPTRTPPTPTRTSLTPNRKLRVNPRLDRRVCCGSARGITGYLRFGDERTVRERSTCGSATKEQSENDQLAVRRRRNSPRTINLRFGDEGTLRARPTCGSAPPRNTPRTINLRFGTPRSSHRTPPQPRENPATAVATPPRAAAGT